MIGIFLLMLLGGPLKNSESYDKPFWDIFEISPFSDQNRVNSGGRGSPQNLVYNWNLPTYVTLKPMQKQDQML